MSACALGAWAARLAAVVLLAASPSAGARHLLSYAPHNSPVVNVTNGQGLKDAVSGAAVHMLVTRHVDMRQLQPEPGGSLCSGGTLCVYPDTYPTNPGVSIQGACPSAFNGSTHGVTLPPLQPQQCVVVVNNTWLYVSGRDVWVNNLHVVVQSRSSSQPQVLLEVVDSEARVWHTSVGLQGDGGAGQLLDVAASKVLIAGGFLGDMKWYYGGVAAYLVSSTSAAITQTSIQNIHSMGTVNKGAVQATAGSSASCNSCSFDAVSQPGLSVDGAGAAVYASDGAAVWDAHNGSPAAALPLSDAPKGLFLAENDRDLVAIQRAASPGPPPSRLFALFVVLAGVLAGALLVGGLAMFGAWCSKRQQKVVDGEAAPLLAQDAVEEGTGSVHGAGRAASVHSAGRAGSVHSVGRAGSVHSVSRAGSVHQADRAGSVVAPELPTSINFAARASSGQAADLDPTGPVADSPSHGSSVVSRSIGQLPSPALLSLDADDQEEDGVVRGNINDDDTTISTPGSDATAFTSARSVSAPSTRPSTRASARLLMSPSTKRTFDVFLAHERQGVDGQNHERVQRVHQSLQRLGVKAWFEEEESRGGVQPWPARGVQESAGVVVFITKEYQEKVTGDDEQDRCKLEFDVAMSKRLGNTVAVVLDREMQESSRWEGNMRTLAQRSRVSLFDIDDLSEEELDSYLGTTLLPQMAWLSC